MIMKTKNIMNITKKKVFIFSFIASLIGFWGCDDDFLEIPIPPGQQTDVQQYQSATGLEHILNQAYAAYGEYFSMHFPMGYYTLGSIRSDDAWAGGEYNDVTDRHNINEFRIFADNSLLPEVWNQCYLSIRYCNIVIDNAFFALENDPTNDEVDHVNSLIAQAHVLRGWGYFMLGRTFGDVPLLLKAGVIEVKPRDPILDVYKQAIKDFQTAIESGHLTKITESIPSSEKGRMNEGAAYAFMAKTYMYMASVDRDNEMEHFQSAYNAAKTLINSGFYGLLSDYSELWKLENKFTKESIYEVGYPPAGLSRLHHHWYATWLRPRYIYKLDTLGLGTREYQAIDGNHGWGFNTPTQDFVDAFAKGDPRLHWTVWFQGDSTTGLSKDGLPHEINFFSSRSGYYYRKTTKDEHFETTKSFMNFKVYRYADLLLIGAEAANEIGESEDALKWLNMIRERARNTVAAKGYEDEKIEGVPLDVTISDKNALRDTIRYERRVELGCEGERFFDLARWHGTHGYDLEQIIENAYKKAGPDYNLTTNAPAAASEAPREPLPVDVQLPKHLLAPIPQNEVELTNGVVKQNPGY
jgi:hypothetical protein